MVNPRNEQTAPTTVTSLAAQFSNLIRRENNEPSERIAPPWESWELDKKFFKALSQWTLENPETDLDRVLDDICNGLENSKELFELVPDSPFPARGLVTALAHLFKLGVTVHRAKRDVQQFSKDVIRWVGRVKSAFDSSPEEGRFTNQTWRNLKDMRNLVDEICVWAFERLQDGRWSRLTNGLMINKEVGEFKERISENMELFRDLSAISQAKGLDYLGKKIGYILDRQQITIVKIQNMRQTQEKHQKQIMNEFEEQKQIAERKRFFAETLDVHMVANPTYDSQGKRPCDEDTRTEVLDEIRKWKDDLTPESQNFLWLTGDPGCGKSAVTASLARECKDANVLWAQFFINRNNADTTDPKTYFPSIARQIAGHSEEVGKTIYETLMNKRSITDDISADQAAKLFTTSIRKASEVDPEHPVVVVIDGLDETERSRLKETAKIFSTLFTSLEGCNNVKVFISSRTEDAIRNPFARDLLVYKKHIKHVHLDTSSSTEDVSRYISRGLMSIVESNDLNWDEWPGEQRSRILGERASGLFIWAVTALKFIDEQLDRYGAKSLNRVLNTLTADVLQDINSLYTLILEITYGPEDPKTSEWDAETFRRIFGAILFLQEPLSIDAVSTLLDLRDPSTDEPIDVIHFVKRFRTILVAGTDAISGDTIPRIHKSVFEFIASNNIDAKFRVDPHHAHLELGMQCLAQLDTAQESITQDVLSIPFRYASRFWSSHIEQSSFVESATICADYRHSTPEPLLAKPFDQIMSDQKPVRIHSLPTKSQIKTLLGRDEKIWNTTEGVAINHAREVPCVVFSPNGEEVVSCSLDKTIRVWNSSDGAWMRTLVNYSSPFYAIAVSPDGKSVVSGSGDNLVCLWNYIDGTPKWTAPPRHTKPVKCIAFSPNGERIISGSEDKTCILWNARNGQQIGAPWVGHRNWVKSISFSASGQRVCSLDGGGNAIIWDATKGDGFVSWSYGKREPRRISFSPTNDDMIATSGWGGVEIRFNNRQWLAPESDFAPCMSFLPNGRQVIFASHNAISVALIGKDKPNTDIVRRGTYRFPPLFKSFAFSPNCDRFVSADKAVNVYALQHVEKTITITPVNELLPLLHRNDDAQTLMDALSDSKSAQGNYNNHRLDAIVWYKKDSGITESAVKLWVVRDNAIIAAYDDGSISVWKTTTTIQPDQR